ncbi:MAG: hypothetical protein AAF353_19605, partial [Pseudomonadota bacterium]
MSSFLRLFYPRLSAGFTCDIPRPERRIKPTARFRVNLKRPKSTNKSHYYWMNSSQDKNQPDS